MTIKEYTNYMLNKYNTEILESYYDQKGTRKNKIKNEEKLEYLKNETKRLFNISELTTTLKTGPSYNCSQNIWIHIHDKNNPKATKDNYLGLSFNKINQAIEIWFGFGCTNMKKKEIAMTKQNYQTKIQSIEPILKRNFTYKSLYVEATVISKSIPLKKINDKEIIDDLLYLKSIYQIFENRFHYQTIPNPTKKEKTSFEIISQIPTSAKIEGKNIMYKGYPGSGKTYTIKQKYLQNIDPMQYEITTFHPNYTNNNFIGSIIPLTENSITTYKFIPGPFTRLLKKAIYNPKTNFYLIIENINNGNYLSIFGDIINILDRTNNGNGKSIYEINNSLIANYLFNNETAKIYLPENLSLIATYNINNISYQSPNPSLERPWNIVWIQDTLQPIDHLYIKGFNYLTWGQFRKVINEQLNTNPNLELLKLSSFFINSSYVSTEPSTNKEERLNFANKVLIFLYEATYKYNKKLIYSESITNIDSILKSITKNNFLNIFNSQISKKLNTKN